VQTYRDVSLLLTVASSNGSGDTAVISVFLRSNNTSQNPTVDVRILSKGGASAHLVDDSFKIITDGWSTDMELWVKKGSTYGGYNVYEISKRLGGGTLTYNATPAWQSAVPTGTVQNVSSAGVYSGLSFTANGSVSGTQLVSAIATGTAPLVVSSTTAVTNLNADLLDGNHASAFALSSHTHTAANISDSTATGRSVLTAASAAAARTAIGAGTGSGDVTLNGVQTLTNKDLTGTGNNINASNLTTGTLPDARMSGTYSGFTHKIDGANSVFSTTSSGSSSSLGRTVYGLAEFRGGSNTTTGAIVFFAPTSGNTIMMQLELSGLLYQQNVVDIVVQGYRSSTTSWNGTRKVSRGSVDVDARWAMTPSGNNCLIIGDVDSVWNYPHFSITRAMFSHTSATDAFCSGWTVGLVTDLSTYTNVSSVIPNLSSAGNISGSAATLTTGRTFQTNLASTSSASFNGSANVTPGVTGTLGVANGGTGRATATTAYGLITAGTTATGAQQTIAPGTAGQFLKSAGASALASFASIDSTDISDSTTTGRSVLTAASAAAARTAIGAGTGNGDVTLTGTQVLTGKTISLANNTITGTTAQFNAALSDNLFATQAGTETLSGKTLTAPRITNNGFIADNNGNEQITFTTTAAAVNDIGITNAATGGAPRIAARGGDTNIDLNLVAKGTGHVQANGVDVATTTDLAGKANTSHTHTAANISDSTATGRSVLTAASASAARTAIGAGTGDGDVTLTGAQVLTGKTINLASNTLVGTIAQFNAALTGNLFVTQAGVETLTAKTISLANNTITGTTAQFNAALSDNLFATQTGSETLTNKRINPRIGTVASAAAPAINVNNVDQFNITALATNITSMTTGLSGTAVDGQKLMIRITGSAARSITWGASFISSGTAMLPASTVAGRTHLIGFIYDSAAARWVCVAVDAAGY